MRFPDLLTSTLLHLITSRNHQPPTTIHVKYSPRRDAQPVHHTPSSYAHHSRDTLPKQDCPPPHVEHITLRIATRLDCLDPQQQQNVHLPTPRLPHPYHTPNGPLPIPAPSLPPLQCKPPITNPPPPYPSSPPHPAITTQSTNPPPSTTTVLAHHATNLPLRPAHHPHPPLPHRPLHPARHHRPSLRPLRPLSPRLRQAHLRHHQRRGRGPARRGVFARAVGRDAGDAAAG